MIVLRMGSANAMLHRRAAVEVGRLQSWLCAPKTDPVLAAVVKTGENAVILDRR